MNYVADRDHKVVGATNDLLLEIGVESWPFAKNGNAVDRDALGDHFITGIGDRDPRAATHRSIEARTMGVGLTIDTHDLEISSWHSSPDASS